MKTRALIGLCLASAGAWLLVGAGHAQQGSPAVTQLNDLDAFMAKVIERRNDNWRTLHDYILSEREQFQIIGPGERSLDSFDREFHWSVQEGFLVRSPIKANGATVGKTDRLKYEQEWLAKEKRREKRLQERIVRNPAGAKVPTESPDVMVVEPPQPAGEPRFISEAYFMKFVFEPGNYYVAGRETFEGRSVVVVEYYPLRLFRERAHNDGTTVSIGASGVKVSRADQKAKPQAPPPAPKPRNKDEEMEREIQLNMNKVSRVIMWIDPEQHQIVKYTFDNADFGFLPYRAILRVDEMRASMTMGLYFEKVWLPKQITFRGGGTLATGSYRVTYDRSFYDYARGEVSAKIRAYIPKDDK